MENKWVGEREIKKKMFQKDKFKQNINLPSHCHLNIFTTRDETFESREKWKEACPIYKYIHFPVHDSFHQPALLLITR